MNQDHCDLATIMSRLNMLERQNRHLRLIWVGSVILFGVVAASGAATLREDVLITQKLILRDSNGKDRCRLEVDPLGVVSQVFLDNNGTERMRLSAERGTKKITSISLFDKDGAEKLTLQCDQDNKAQLQMFHSPTQLGALMSVGGDGSSAQMLFDKNVPRIASTVLANGSSMQILTDTNGKRRFGHLIENSGEIDYTIAGADETNRLNWKITKDGEATQAIHDKTGQRRFLWFIDAQDNSYQTIGDKHGVPRFLSSVDSDNKAYQSLNDTKGTPRMSSITGPKDDMFHGYFDAQNVLRIMFGVGSDSHISLFDTHKIPRIIIKTDAKGRAHSGLSDPDGHERMTTLTTQDGTFLNLISDRARNIRVGTVLRSDNSAAHYVEKTAQDNALVGLDWLLRLKDILMLLQ